MNDYFTDYKLLLKQQWQSMDSISRTFAVLICFLLLFGGLISGLFLFGVSLVITLALYLQSLLTKMTHKSN